VIGYYNKPDDKCYLIGGVNSNLASPKEVAEYVDVKKSKLVSKSLYFLKFLRVEDHKIE